MSHNQPEQPNMFFFIYYLISEAASTIATLENMGVMTKMRALITNVNSLPLQNFCAFRRLADIQKVLGTV